MDSQPIELSQIVFKRFIATMYKLVVEQSIKYDVIIIGGNTGLAMARFTQSFYETVKVEPPVVLKTTPQRYKPGTKHEDEKPENLFDNSVLINDIKNQIRDYKIGQFKNILFVDDEIYLGSTAKTCIDILSRVANDQKLHYTIIAEDSGFTGFDLPENVEMKFIPFSKEIDGFYNMIMSIIPNEINRELELVFPHDEIPFHKRINLLLGLSYKR